MATPIVKRPWPAAFIRTALSSSSYALGAALRLFPALALSLYAAIGGAVALITFTVEYYGNIKPAQEFEEVAPVLMDACSLPFMDFVKGTGINARLNVMLPVRTWRWFGLRRYFAIRWSAGMENQPDVNIKFPISYGVAGECLRRKRTILANSDALASPKYALPKRIRHHADQTQVIWSQPIYEPIRRGRQSGKLIGVLNLDSTSRHAYNLFVAQRMSTRINEQMGKIAVIASHIFR
jgi:hypothetical protein